MAIEFQGKVSKSIFHEKPDAYASEPWMKINFVEIEMICGDGSKVWFNSPAISVNTRHNHQIEAFNDWVVERPIVTRAMSWGQFGMVNPSIHVGSVIRVSGRIKKQYRSGVAINYVKMIEIVESVHPRPASCPCCQSEFFISNDEEWTRNDMEHRQSQFDNFGCDWCFPHP